MDVTLVMVQWCEQVTHGKIHTKQQDCFEYAKNPITTITGQTLSLDQPPCMTHVGKCFDDCSVGLIGERNELLGQSIRVPFFRQVPIKRCEQIDLQAIRSDQIYVPR